MPWLEGDRCDAMVGSGHDDALEGSPGAGRAIRRLGHFAAVFPANVQMAATEGERAIGGTGSRGRQVATLVRLPLQVLIRTALKATDTRGQAEVEVRRRGWVDGWVMVLNHHEARFGREPAPLRDSEDHVPEYVEWALKPLT